MNDFTELYETWSDEDMLDAFHRRADYLPEAQSAMRAVLDRRGLLTDAINKEVQAKEIIHRQTELKYDRQTFGDSVSDQEFAKRSRRADGVYMDGYVQRRASRGKAFLIIGHGLFFIVLFCIRLTARELFRHDAEVFLGLGLLASAIGFRMLQGNKIPFSLYEMGGGIFLDIDADGRVQQFSFPFEYEFYAGMQHISVKPHINAPFLYALIKSPTGDQMIFEEQLTLLENLPPFWPSIHALQMKNIPCYVKYGFGRIDLRNMKKILDGLEKV